MGLLARIGRLVGALSGRDFRRALDRNRRAAENLDRAVREMLRT